MYKETIHAWSIMEITYKFFMHRKYDGNVYVIYNQKIPRRIREIYRPIY